nr:DEAD-box ATP-dependent RNA helicase 11-like isoform X3 [Hydra vulgaris]
MDSTIHKLEGLRLQNLQNNVHYTCSPCGKHNCFVCLTKCEACRNLNCSCRTIEYGNEISRVKPKPSIYNNSLIKVGGVGDFCEIKSFRDANLPEVLIENLRKLLYKVPTPVQSIAIPILLEGKDLVARAETGSGKTAAFLIPIVSTLIKRKTVNSMNPFAVILTPTRELALQIEREALLLTENTFIKPVCTYGGITIGHQKKKIAKGCDILIGTLGRILHLAKQSMLSLKELKILIIDEGDHMLDKNFVKDIGKLVHDFDMPEKSLRQTALFCATIPTTQIIHDDKGVKKKLAFFTDTVCMFLNDTYCHVDVGNNLVTPKSIIQQFLFVDKLELKFQLLEKKIAEELSNENKTIVFIETIKETIKVAQQLCIKDYPVTVIHGIGRAGRIGNPGKSISLFLKGRDEVLAKPLVVLLGGSQQEVPTWLEELCLVREMAKLGNYSQAIYETKRVAMLTEKNSSDDTRRFEDKGKVKDISYRFSKLTPI